MLNKFIQESDGANPNKLPLPEKAR